MRLSDFSVLTFDCYGTLIDWESGIVAGLRPLIDKLADPPDRETLLAAHAFHESTAQAETPTKRYPELLATVAKRIAEEFAIPASWDECLAYGESVKDWPAFPDSAEALAALKEHYRLVVLSNVDNRSFAASAQKLGVHFDAVYTAEDIGSYKPAARNFQYMLAMLARRGIRAADILHTAESLFHDHQMAGRMGLATAWIHRRHEKEGFGAARAPAEVPRCDFRFTSMAAMVAAHRGELTATGPARV